MFANFRLGLHNLHTIFCDSFSTNSKSIARHVDVSAKLDLNKRGNENPTLLFGIEAQVKPTSSNAPLQIEINDALFILAHGEELFERNPDLVTDRFIKGNVLSHDDDDQSVLLQL